jgi:hypothetical protein
VSDLPFGPIGSPRRPCQWAALHAGVEFLPQLDRDCLELRQLGFGIEAIAAMVGIDPLEVERNLARSCRTLITWERNACRWANRYVAVEPMVAVLGDNRERVSQQRPGTQRGVQGRRL